MQSHSLSHVQLYNKEFAAAAHNLQFMSVYNWKIPGLKVCLAAYHLHSNLDIMNLDIVNKTQLPFWRFTKHITFDWWIIQYSEQKESDRLVHYIEVWVYMSGEKKTNRVIKQAYCFLLDSGMYRKVSWITIVMFVIVGIISWLFLFHSMFIFYLASLEATSKSFNLCHLIWAQKNIMKMFLN